MTVRSVTRRAFLGSALSSGALVLAAELFPRAVSPDTAPPPSPAPPDTTGPFRPNLFLAIDTDGSVHVLAHRSEMGNGSRTALPRVLADELDADWTRVHVTQAVGDARLGSQDTDGSTSVRLFFDTMRELGASARLMLVRAAAQGWGVPEAECETEAHVVVHRTSARRVGYGELVTAAAALPVPKKEELALKPRSAWRYVGHDAPSIDLEDLCTGRASFGMDAHVEGMLVASIERPPALGGRVRSFDAKEALRVPGVRQVVALDAPPDGPPAFQAVGGVAVLADDTWAAMKGRRRLTVQWEPGPHAAHSSGAFRKELRETAHRPGRVVREAGDVDAVFAKAGTVVEADYYVPLVAHAPMEPPVALVDAARAECWVSAQNPQAVQAVVGKVLGRPKEEVVCHVPLLGGGFGRKSFPDFAAEAALLSKKSGRPVKVVWTREDDLRHDYYLPPAALFFKAALDERGQPKAWLQRSVFPSIDSTFDAAAASGSPWELSRGFVDLPFQLPNLRAECGPAAPHVRLGWVRSVSNTYHLFGVYSFLDELAHAAGADPLEYLLGLIGPPRVIPRDEFPKDYVNEDAPYDRYPVDTGRLRHVIELAAERAGWKGRRSGGGFGMGLAAHRTILAYVAVVAQVEVDRAGALHIRQIDTAVDAGTLVNPDNVRAQFQGASVFATSILRSGEITLTHGAVDQANFDTYPVARMDEAPHTTRVHLVDSDAPPTGLGEAGVPLVLPAVCNAIFAATGTRVRELPLTHTPLRARPARGRPSPSRS